MSAINPYQQSSVSEPTKFPNKMSVGEGNSSIALPPNDALEIQFTFSKNTTPKNEHIRFGCIQLNELGFVTDVIFDDHNGPLHQLSNYHKTLSLKSSNHTENDGEYSQSFLIKPTLSQLFTNPKELLDVPFKLFLKDFHKQSLKGMNYIEAFNASKLEVAHEMEVFKQQAMDDEEFDIGATLSDPLKTYRGKAKCFVFFVEGDLSRCVSPQSNLIVEWGKYVYGDNVPKNIKTEFKSDCKFTFPYPTLAKFKNTRVIYLSSMLWMDNSTQTCQFTPLGLNLGNQTNSVMECYKTGLIHDQIPKNVFPTQNDDLIPSPYKYFELKKNNSIVLEGTHHNSGVKYFYFEISHTLVGKKFSISSKAACLDKGNYVMSHIGEPVFHPSCEKPVIVGKTHSKSDCTFSIDLNHVPDGIEKILFVSVFQGNSETNFIRVRDSVMKVYNEKKELVSALFASPGTECCLIWGVLKRLPRVNNGPHRWELYNMDQYTDQTGHLGAYRYAVRHLPVVSPLNDTVDTCPLLSNSSANLSTTVEFSTQKPLNIKLRSGKRLAPYLVENDDDDEDEGFTRKLSKKPFITMDLCYFDKYGYHVFHETAKQAKNKYNTIFEVLLKDQVANFPSLKTLFIKLSLRLPETTIRGEPKPYYDCDFEDDTRPRTLSQNFIDSIVDETHRFIVFDDEKNQDLFSVTIQDLSLTEQQEALKKIKDKTVIKPSFETDMLMIKLEKVDIKSDLWKVVPLRADFNRETNWIEKIRKEMLSDYIRLRPAARVLAPNEIVSTPFVDDIYKDVITSVMAVEACKIQYKPKLQVLTVNSAIELTEQNCRYGNPLCVEIITSQKRFTYAGENSRFEVIYKDYDIQTQMLGIVINFELTAVPPPGETIVLKYFDQIVGGEKFRIVIDPSKCGWEKVGDILSVMSVMKDVGTRMINSQSLCKVNMQDFNCLLPEPPKHLMVKIIKAVDLPAHNSDKHSDPYVVAKFDDGKKEVNKKKTSLFITDPIKKCLNPVWNQSFMIKLIGDIKADTRVLAFHLYDKESISKDNYMGLILVNMKDIVDKTEVSYPLKPNTLIQKKPKEIEKVKGKLYLSYEFLY